jgi:hypothetical protein
MDWGSSSNRIGSPETSCTKLAQYACGNEANLRYIEINAKD